MYSYDKIKSTIRIYVTRLKYNLNVADILEMVEIARSTLYEWIRDFSYLLNEPDKFVLHSRILKGLRSNRKVSDAIKKFIIDHVTKNPNFSMKKLMKKLKNTYNMTISKGHVYKILRDNKFTFKKVQKMTYPYGKTKFKKAVNTLKKEIDKCNNNFTAIDETSVYLGTPKTYGWSLIGTRCKVKSTFNRSKKYSLCQAISNKKVIAYELIKGSFNTKKFNDFIKNKVMPNMTNDTILLDGASIHKSKKLSDILAEHGVTKIINVPYSPQFNPIEFTFNTLKLKIKLDNVTTKKHLDKTMLRYFKQANRDGFENYYNHTYNNIQKAI